MKDHCVIGQNVYSQHFEQSQYQVMRAIHEREGAMDLSQRGERGLPNVATLIVEPGDFKAQLQTLQYELEEAIDEHLKLLRQNKMLKKNSWQKELELEYQNLSFEHESLLADVERKHKEIMACERIIKILQTEISQRRLGHKGW